MSAEASPSGTLKIQSYEPVKIKFDRSREVLQTNRWTGDVVERDKATETHIILDATLEFRGFRPRFEILGIIKQKGVDTDKLEHKVKAAVAAGLRNRVVWDFYQMPEVVVEPNSPELDKHEGDGELDDIIAATLEEQAKANDQAAKEWKTAIDEMQQYLLEDVRYHISDLRDAFSFVRSCTEASRQGTMYGWCQEKLAYIRSSLDDLARRKDPNHDGFKRSVQTIRGPLYSWPITNGFHRQPPRRQKRQRLQF
jgi:hypothetical protein